MIKQHIWYNIPQDEVLSSNKLTLYNINSVTKYFKNTIVPAEEEVSALENYMDIKIQIY